MWIEEIEGVKVCRPTREAINALAVGDPMLNVFGEIATVTEITYSGHNVNGEAYVGYYTESDDGLKVSGSATEGHLILTTPAIRKWHRMDAVPMPV